MSATAATRRQLSLAPLALALALALATWLAIGVGSGVQTGHDSAPSTDAGAAS